ncbi:hypothetical protein Poly51_47500 [Rubripirellula tenax]|uniref:Stf0 sulfotransferase n=1 Tax=Rubripirellula tenax TaxID=2528015 RepID=A0A5C6EMR4_9BACT|nr:sulfotransferase [Rubripirellula tenax]TWU48846.1 hypothetical protein Poly51_47500 [Rubripirellula tenax]
MNCRTPFFIWFHHRSGSSHLCSLLDSHPEIACWGEFFYRGEAGVDGDLFTRSACDTEAEFLNDVYSHRWSPSGATLCADDPEPPLATAVGFKLKYQQGDSYPCVLDHLRSHRSMKAIHLVRTNLVAALLSASMIPRLLDQFQRANLLATTPSHDLDRTVWLDTETILDELVELESRIDVARRELDAMDCLEVTYENLIDSPKKTCQSILDFLDVDASIELVSRLQKIMPHSIAASLGNFDEVSEALEGTRFAVHLDSSSKA